MSKGRLSAGAVSAPTRAVTTSVTATGSTWLSIHVGSTWTGIRSLIWRMISNEVEPLPTIIAARRASVGTPESVSTCSTSSLDLRCGDRSPSAMSGTRPPR